MKITTIGLDLAKPVFHVAGLNEWGKEVMRRRLRRVYAPQPAGDRTGPRPGLVGREI